MELLLQQNRDLINSLLHNSENLSHAIDEEVKNRLSAIIVERDSLREEIRLLKEDHIGKGAKRLTHGCGTELGTHTAENSLEAPSLVNGQDTLSHPSIVPYEEYERVAIAFEKLLENVKTLESTKDYYKNKFRHSKDRIKEWERHIDKLSAKQPRRLRDGSSSTERPSTSNSARHRASESKKLAMSANNGSDQISGHEEDLRNDRSRRVTDQGANDHADNGGESRVIEFQDIMRSKSPVDCSATHSSAVKDSTIPPRAQWGKEHSFSLAIDDEVEVVKERQIRKRRRADSQAPAREVRVKFESSPLLNQDSQAGLLIPGRIASSNNLLSSHQYNLESLDLDEITGSIHTPRRTRRPSRGPILDFQEQRSLSVATSGKRQEAPRQFETDIGRVIQPRENSPILAESLNVNRNPIVAHSSAYADANLYQHKRPHYEASNKDPRNLQSATKPITNTALPRIYGADEIEIVDMRSDGETRPKSLILRPEATPPSVEDGGIATPPEATRPSTAHAAEQSKTRRVKALLEQTPERPRRRSFDPTTIQRQSVNDCRTRVKAEIAPTSLQTRNIIHQPVSIKDKNKVLVKQSGSGAPDCRADEARVLHQVASRLQDRSVSGYRPTTDICESRVSQSRPLPHSSEEKLNLGMQKPEFMRYRQYPAQSVEGSGIAKSRRDCRVVRDNVRRSMPLNQGPHNNASAFPVKTVRPDSTPLPRSSRQQTPPGFWRTEMPSTAQAEEDREAALML